MSFNFREAIPLSTNKFKHPLKAVVIPLSIASISAGCQIRVIPPTHGQPLAQLDPTIEEPAIQIPSTPDNGNPLQEVTHLCEAVVPEPASDEVVTVIFDYPLPKDTDINTVQLTVLGKTYEQKSLFSTAGEASWWVLPVIRGIAPMVITQWASRGPDYENLTVQFYGFEETPANCQRIAHTLLP